jgi:uncharacterized protein
MRSANVYFVFGLILLAANAAVPVAAQVANGLIAAAEQGDLSALSRALAGGAPIDGRDSRGRTALLAATHADRLEAVRALIKAGAKLDPLDDLLDTPLLFAGAEGRLEILKLLLAAGASTRILNRYGGTALIPAAEHGHVEVVRELLVRSDVDVNHVNRLGWTALLEAVLLGSGGERHQAIVQLLLQHGADPNIPDKDGTTALGHARRRGFREIECLLAAPDGY